jgi:beta-lactamase class A
MTHSQCLRTYSLLNPWLHCEYAMHDAHALRSEGLQRDLEAYMEEQKALGTIIRASVAFQYPDGDVSFQSFGNERYAPGSLLKVPIMIAVFKQAQEDPTLLTRQVMFKDGVRTVQDLVDTMIVDSDNEAREMLLKLIQELAPDGKPLRALSAELRLNDAETGVEDFLHVGTYATLLRTLYDASYLNKAMSQKALALLSQARYENGLVAGIPDDIAVAHKFGIREDRGQIHDCGIIYFPHDPYILCVMMKAASIPQGEQAIAELSRRTYEFVRKHADE